MPALLKLLSGERGASLRIVAASALGSIQDATRALPALVDMLAEKDPLLRTAVAKVRCSDALSPRQRCEKRRRVEWTTPQRS